MTKTTTTTHGGREVVGGKNEKQRNEGEAGRRNEKHDKNIEIDKRR
jgi:hypothetical protein